MSAKFYIFDTDSQNFIFRAAEIMLKFRFELARDDCADTLRRAKFRLPRRINLRLFRRLNLKCALL